MERLIKALGYAVGYFLAVAWLFVAIGFWQMATAEDINPEFDLRTTTVMVHWYATERELQESTGYDDIAGVSECEWRPDFGISFCEFWLVTPTDSTDAYAFDTIGHEFYHALAGVWHDD